MKKTHTDLGSEPDRDKERVESVCVINETTRRNRVREAGDRRPDGVEL